MAPDFARQITENQQRLYGYIRSLVGNSAWSWDILQETNLVIWEKQASFAPGTNFRAWAFRIAKFQVLAFLRDRKREPFMLLTPDLVELLNDDAEDLAEQHVERLQVLARCRESLNDSSRRLLQLFYEEERSIASIAELLGQSPNAVKQAIYRARRSLMECILKTSPALFNE